MRAFGGFAGSFAGNLPASTVNFTRSQNRQRYLKLEKELESQLELAFALKLEPESEPVLKLAPESVLAAISDTELVSAGYKNIGVDSPRIRDAAGLARLRGLQICPI